MARPTPTEQAAREELQRATMHSIDTLRQRGILLTGDEQPGELADLQTAVERFDAAVRDLGGDSFTNSPLSSEPDDPALVVPERRRGEAVTEYIQRIDEAAAGLRGR
ncbi:MAG: hypothetical protein M3Y31_08350 [Gemmatimonadota bacterium]|jgi:hypothetical protein|nr:hypothetical protein [Gemmatimonadota bacterium]